MLDLTVLANQLLQLFLIICVGYILYKTGRLDDNVNRHINSIIVDVTMPCMIISSVLSMSDRPGNSLVVSLFIISISFFIIMPVLAFIIVKLMDKTVKIPRRHRGLYMFMMVFSNIGFMGMPLLQAAYGENGGNAVFYAAVLNIFFNIAVFTYGVIMIGYGDSVQTGFHLKDLLSPGILCSVIALVIYAFNISFPATITGVIDSIGDLTSPLAMMMVGSTLASIRVREIFTQWRIYVFCIIKQFILPILLYPLLKLCMEDEMLFNVMFVELLMPVANIALILANQQNLDYKFVSKTIFISTVMSLISIPAVMYLCPLIWS